MGSVEGPMWTADVVVVSPPKFKSTGDVRRTLLVLLAKSIRLPADGWPDDDRHGKSRFRNLDLLLPPGFKQQRQVHRQNLEFKPAPECGMRSGTLFDFPTERVSQTERFFTDMVSTSCWQHGQTTTIYLEIYQPEECGAAILFCSPPSRPALLLLLFLFSPFSAIIVFVSTSCRILFISFFRYKLKRHPRALKRLRKWRKKEKCPDSGVSNWWCFDFAFLRNSTYVVSGHQPWVMTSRASSQTIQSKTRHFYLFMSSPEIQKIKKEIKVNINPTRRVVKTWSSRVDVRVLDEEIE